MAWARWIALPWALLALGGCFSIRSEPSAVPDAALLSLPPLAAGLYCAVETRSEDGAQDKIDPSTCLQASFAAGILTIEPVSEDDADARPVDFRVASLGRGLFLLQTRDAKLERFDLYTLVLRPEGAAVLPPPELTRAAAHAAERYGVTLDAEAGDLDPGDRIPFEIRAGEPETVLAFLRDATGLWLDAALRDPELTRQLHDEAIMYVRMDAHPHAQEPDLDAAAAQVDVLRQAIMRAMALE